MCVKLKKERSECGVPGPEAGLAGVSDVKRCNCRRSSAAIDQRVGCVQPSMVDTLIHPTLLRPTFTHAYALPSQLTC
jgi:hypothetical protein